MKKILLLVSFLLLGYMSFLGATQPVADIKNLLKVHVKMGDEPSCDPGEVLIYYTKTFNDSTQPIYSDDSISDGWFSKRYIIPPNVTAGIAYCLREATRSDEVTYIPMSVKLNQYKQMESATAYFTTTLPFLIILSNEPPHGAPVGAMCSVKNPSCHTLSKK
jgi:hypothetical protein